MNDINTNLLVATIIVAGVIFIALFIFCNIQVSKMRQRVQDELSGKAGVYKGPAGEPLWNGTQPKEVNDYTKPRYVYENLVETTEFRPENGRIIGYRISPSLVIHSRVQKVKPSAVTLYRDRFGGELLDFSDIKILVSEWQEISKLRVAAGDEALSSRFIFATYRGSIVICNTDEMTWGYPDYSLLKEHLLILKR